MQNIVHYLILFIILIQTVFNTDCLEDFGDSEFANYFIAEYEEPEYSEELKEQNSIESFQPFRPILTEFATELTQEISHQGLPKIHCTKTGYLPDPNDCRKFFSCVSTVNGFQIIPLSCVAGTVFESIGSKCTNAFKDCVSYKSRSSGLGYGIEKKREAGTPPSLVIVDKSDAETIITTTEPTYTTTSIPKSASTTIEPEAEFLPQQLKQEDGTLELLPGFTVQSWNDMNSEIHSTNPSMAKNKIEKRGINKVIKTSHSTPNAWFGLVKATNPGNPFKDEETSLAIILDFNTARLQIYSRNAPRKRVIK